MLVSSIPWKHLNCIVECLQLEQEVDECFPLAVNSSFLAIEAQAEIIVL